MIKVGTLVAARMYLVAQGCDPDTFDASALRLSLVMDEFAKAAIKGSLARAREIYRQMHPGGCRLLSEGDGCRCFLCQLDEIAKDNGVKLEDQPDCDSGAILQIEPLRTIYYECPNCDHHWTEKWSCACDSTCPHCMTKNIQASDSEPAE